MEGWLEAKKGFASLRSRSGRSSTSKLGRERSRPRSLVSVDRGEVFLNQTLIIIRGYILIMDVLVYFEWLALTISFQDAAAAATPQKSDKREKKKRVR